MRIRAFTLGTLASPASPSAHASIPNSQHSDDGWMTCAAFTALSTARRQTVSSLVSGRELSQNPKSLSKNPHPSRGRGHTLWLVTSSLVLVAGVSQHCPQTAMRSRTPVDTSETHRKATRVTHIAGEKKN